MTKHAEQGATCALKELGLEKTAIVGKILGAVGRGIGYGTARMGAGIGKGMHRLVRGKPVKGMVGGVEKTVGHKGGLYNMAATPIKSTVEGVGEGVLGAAKGMGASGKTLDFMRQAGKGIGGEAAGFGLFGGGMNAALADPGDRMNAFLRGAAGGVLGGVAFGGAKNLARMGILKGLGKSAPGMQNLAAQPFWQTLGQQGGAGQAAKILGARTPLNYLPLAAGMGASFMTPIFEKEHAPQRPLYQQPQTYYPMMRSLALRPQMGYGGGY